MLTHDPLLYDGPERGGPAPPAGCVAILVAALIGLAFFGALAVVVWRSLA